jgi:hypothetical protein
MPAAAAWRRSPADRDLAHLLTSQLAADQHVAIYGPQQVRFRSLRAQIALGVEREKLE